jgi:hypothetical protein
MKDLLRSVLSSVVALPNQTWLQFARYLAQEMQTSQLLDDEEDEEDEDSGWLARSTFRMQSQSALSQPTLSRPTTQGFDVRTRLN